LPKRNAGARAHTDNGNRPEPGKPIGHPHRFIDMEMM